MSAERLYRYSRTHVDRYVRCKYGYNTDKKKKEKKKRAPLMIPQFYCATLRYFKQFLLFLSCASTTFFPSRLARDFVPPFT